jgi:glycosyltransferase involved in cell wall biosynthesis
MAENENMRIAVVIPAFNEEQAIGKVVGALPKDRIAEIIVVDNNSTDNTAEVAASAGARVVFEVRPGYGAACFAGARAGRASDIIVFLDGDYSDDPEQLEAIINPLLNDHADLVIGSRIGGEMENGAMPIHGRLGNHFIILLLRLLHGITITDLGSFRAIKTAALFKLNMEQMTYGWPLEMVVKATRQGLRLQSVPIRYRKRLGESKITGTWKGTILATCYLLLLPVKYLFGEK